MESCSGLAEFRLVFPAAVCRPESLSGARIRVFDDPSCEECLILVTVDPAAATSRGDSNSNTNKEEAAAEEMWTVEQKALVRVYERMVRGEAGGNGKDDEGEEVTWKMVIGRGIGKVLEKIESESGVRVRVLPKDRIPASSSAFVSPDDELIQMTGSYSAVKKVLLSVSSCVQGSPREDAANSNVTKPAGMIHHGNPMPALGEPFPQRGYAPGFHSRGYLAGPETPGPHNRMFLEEDVVFKLLCHLDKVGSLIGKGGSIIRTMQNETGASIKIADIVPDSEERVVIISARENSDMRHSPAQDAVMRVSSRIAEIGFEPGAAVVARLLVHSQQIGCLLGRGGHIVSEMRRATGASIRVFPKEQSPKCGSPNDEVVQVIGNYHSVQDALFHITSRLRDTIFPMKPPIPNNGPPYMPHFPDMPPPPFRPRHNPSSPHSYPSPIGHFHGIDRQPPFSHCMDHMGPPNLDRIAYPYGNERPGHGPPFDRPPSPRSWAPQAVGSGNHRGVEVNSGFMSRSGSFGSGNHAPNLTSSTVEVVIPQAYMAHVYGDNNSNLGHIRQISGANVAVNDPKPGATEGAVVVSGTSDQMRAAQSLIQAFILCGQTS